MAVAPNAVGGTITSITGDVAIFQLSVRQQYAK